MFSALIIVQVLLGLSLIGLVLLQQGKGADMGAAFGAGSAGTVFGSRGGGSFLSRTTAVLAAGFFLNSILLSSPLVRDVQDPNASVTERVAIPQQTDVPVVDEAVEEAAADLPPTDLPEVPEERAEVAAETAEDLPPVEVQEQSDPTEQSADAEPSEKAESDRPE
jgi:preprotein translocase subunit SecG